MKNPLNVLDIALDILGSIVILTMIIAITSSAKTSTFNYEVQYIEENDPNAMFTSANDLYKAGKYLSALELYNYYVTYTQEHEILTTFYINSKRIYSTDELVEYLSNHKDDLFYLRSTYSTGNVIYGVQFKTK